MNRIFEAAYRAWLAQSTLRARRGRYKRFTYGNQWSDTVEGPDGRTMCEEAAIRLSGKRPMTNNLIRQLVKNIVGRYRTRCAEAGVYAATGDGGFSKRNCLAELDSRLLEEFLISGCAIQRISCERRFAGSGVWVDNVSPDDFFVNAFRDPRGWDIELVGMLHSMTLPEIVNRFGLGGRYDASGLRSLFASCSDCEASLAETGAEGHGVSFHRAAAPGKHRVVEVWTFDARPCESGAGNDFVWHCRWFAPDGTLIADYDSPYGHRSHPFAIKFYPLTDGEVHSFVEDVIEQQKAINRLIVQIDHVMATSAKGVLLFPLDQKPTDMPWAEVSRRWAQPDGILPITGQGVQLPQQVVTAGASDNAYRLLELQMKLFEDVSGVSEALLGKGLGGVRGSELYESQVRNATVALADIFDSFAAFVDDRTAKALAAA